MAYTLRDIQQTKHKTPPRIILHGVEGVGKSTWAAHAPNPIFIKTEDGLNGIDAKSFPLCQKFTDINEQLDVLINEQHEFKTVVLDSADWAEKLIHEKVCQDYSVDTINKAAGGYGNGPLAANNYWYVILGKLQMLNDRGMFVIMICHSKIVTVLDPLNEAYDCYKLKLHSPKSGNGSCEIFQEWADIIGFANILVMTRKAAAGLQTGGDSDKKKNNAVSSGERILYLGANPAYIAKNRYSLPDEMPLDFNALLSAL